MPGVASTLLLVAFGTAHAARHASIEEHEAIGTSVGLAAQDTEHIARRASGAHRSSATNPQVQLNLPENQYVLEWQESPSSWKAYLKVKNQQQPEWYFIIPVMCRRTGIWYKVEMLHKQDVTNCLKVTCGLKGNVLTVEPLESCVEFPARLVQTHGPYLTRSNDWALLHHPHFNFLPSVNTKTAVANGWQFQTKEVKFQLTYNVAEDSPEFFDFAMKFQSSANELSKKCKEYQALWQEVDATFTDEASLQTCKEKRTAVRESCAKKWQPFIGETTAWGTKELFKNQDTLAGLLPSCATWCNKNKCWEKEAPVGVKRDTAAMIASMNSWKYTCEQELDALLTKRVVECHAKGEICDKPWSEFVQCAQKNSVPFGEE